MTEKSFCIRLRKAPFLYSSCMYLWLTIGYSAPGDTDHIILRYWEAANIRLVWYRASIWSTALLCRAQLKKHSYFVDYQPDYEGAVVSHRPLSTLLNLGCSFCCSCKGVALTSSPRSWSAVSKQDLNLGACSRYLAFLERAEVSWSWAHAGPRTAHCICSCGINFAAHEFISNYLEFKI